MNVEISPETEARLAEEAGKLGISVGALLDRLLNERSAGTVVSSASELPVWHLGGAGSLHRRDIYETPRGV